MSSIIEFDIVNEYDLYKVGIVVEVRLRLGNIETVVDPSIDTGSTNCIFERRLGEELGLTIESGTSVSIGTATGSFRAYSHEVELSVLGIDLHSTVYFAESDLFDRNVLGRNGFLNKVKFGLIEPEGKLFMSLYQE